MYITGHADSCVETSSKVPLEAAFVLYSHLNSCIPIGYAGEGFGGRRAEDGAGGSERGGATGGAAMPLHD